MEHGEGMLDQKLLGFQSAEGRAAHAARGDGAGVVEHLQKRLGSGWGGELAVDQGHLVRDDDAVAVGREGVVRENDLLEVDGGRGTQGGRGGEARRVFEGNRRRDEFCVRRLAGVGGVVPGPDCGVGAGAGAGAVKGPGLDRVVAGILEMIVP